MEPALKQRLIGAMVLVALAVIFLPMLIKGPAPESGASDVSLKLPDAPQGDYETRELPLVTPGNAPAGGALGMDAQVGNDGALPTVDTTTAGVATADAGSTGMMPAATAGGDYAVSFGSYASSADAARVVSALTSSQLPGYQEASPVSGGRTLYRVRIGPYASQAEAEAARLRAAHVRDDVGAKVVVLNADAAPPVSAPATRPAPTADKPPESKPVAAKPAAPAPAKPVEVAKPIVQAPSAAAGVGFAVQLGAFSSTAEADKLRDRARAAGFSAFVQQVRTDKGTLSRVRVGPVMNRADADQLKAQVSAKLGISGIVQSHP
ncbi:MAG TPA: SPOR domain-containing protein [Lysobacter sp.]